MLEFQAHVCLRMILIKPYFSGRVLSCSVVPSSSFGNSKLHKDVEEGENGGDGNYRK